MDKSIDNLVCPRKKLSLKILLFLNFYRQDLCEIGFQGIHQIGIHLFYLILPQNSTHECFNNTIKIYSKI